MKNKDEIALHDYFDNLLSPGERVDFEEILVEYIDLAIDLRKLTTLHRILRNLPVAFQPNESVINIITDSISERGDDYIPPEPKSKPPPKKEKKKKKKKKKNFFKEDPVEESFIEESPLEESFVEEGFIEESPLEESFVEESFIDESPLEESFIEEKPVKESRSKEKPDKKRPVKKRSARRKSKGLRAKTKFRIKQFFYFLIFLVFVGVAFSVFYFYQKIDNTFPWKVNVISESSQPDKKLLPNFISEDEQLVTYKNNFIRITVANKGFIELKGECEIASIKGTQSNNSISFIKGDLKFSPLHDNDLFQLEYNDVTIRSKNSEFQIKTYDKKPTTLNILTNTIEIEYVGKVSKIPFNHTIQVLDKRNLSIPLITSSSKKYTRLVNQFNIQQNDKTIRSIINTSKKDNAFTLFFMLQNVEPLYKELIIERLQKFFPLPDSITKVNILLLDQNSLNAWWEEIYSNI